MSAREGLIPCLLGLSIGIGGLVGWVAEVHAIPPADFPRPLKPVGDIPLTDQDLQAGVLLSGNSRTSRVGSADSANTGDLTAEQRDARGVQLALVGGDNCNEATVVPVTVGAPGFPNTVTINGDNSAGTGPECADLIDVWWEAFETDKCADVTVDFCGTSPRLAPSYIFVATECAPDGSSCGGFLGVDSWSRDLCPGEGSPGNMSMFFDGLPAGTYYYPIIADGAFLANPPGPYVMHITAEECTGACAGCVGACCNPITETCTDDVAEDACTAPDEQWSARAQCCEVECRDPAGPEYDSSGVKLLSQVPLDDFASVPDPANEAWGYVSPSGREYAIMGLACSVAFVEVTDPLNPVIVGEIPGPCSIWRDTAILGEFAYTVIDGSGVGVQVIDLTGIDGGTVTLSATVNPAGFMSAHNIVINEDSGLAYVVSSNINTGITALDLSNPTNPVWAGEWTETNVHDAQVVSYTSGPFAGREIAFVCAPFIAAGFQIVDVTDPGAMFTRSTVSYPNASIGHQGWLSEDRRYFFFGDEGDESNSGLTTTTYVFDVQDLDNPFLLTTFTNDECAIDHNMMVRGSNLYLANYSTGLRIYNVSDVNNIEEVGYFDTHPESNVTDYVGAWGVYTGLPSGIVLVSDRQRGLFVFDVSQAVTGACCDGGCEDGVLEEDCQGGDLEWFRGRRCDEVDCAPLVAKFSQPPKGDCECNGDVDGNGFLEVADVLVVTDCVNGDCSGCVNSCDLDCDGDVDVEDAEIATCLFAQLPDCCPLPHAGEDIPSNIDWADMDPNVVVADDWVSDGRRITAVRWWGSDLEGGGPPSVGWNDDMESYSNESNIHGQGGWKGWDNNPVAGALVTQEQNHSTGGLQAVRIVGASDLVHPLAGHNSGVWNLRAWQYVPSGLTSTTYFLVQKEYNDGGPYQWSIQLRFDPDGTVHGDCGAADNCTPTTWNANAWNEIYANIDLDADVVELYYNGLLVGSYQWTAGIFGNDSGCPAGGCIGAIDLFADGSSPVYYDDLELTAGGPAPEPDGWFVSFHQPLALEGDQTPPLGLYFCDRDVVTQTPTPLPACDAHPVVEYFANLRDCCLVHSNPDSRSGLVPAVKDVFLEENCFTYALDIQAVAGHKFIQDPKTLECIEVPTGNPAGGDFWGWYTTSNERGREPAKEGMVKMGPPPEEQWLYGPWNTTVPVCSSPNMAFELLTPEQESPNPDLNDDGIPDNCACCDSSAPEPLLIPDSVSGNPLKVVTTNRMLIFTAGDDCSPNGQAIRVTYTDLAPPFDIWNNQVLYVGEPKLVTENGSQLEHLPGSADSVFAKLQCTPYCRNDWASLGDLHVFQEGVVPESTYDIEVVDCNCTDQEGAYSPSLTLDTSNYGDIVRDCTKFPCAPPEGGLITVLDFQAVVDAFTSSGGAVRKARADLEPNCLDLVINVADWTEAIAAFNGLSYTFVPKSKDGPCPKSCTNPLFTLPSIP